MFDPRSRRAARGGGVCAPTGRAANPPRRRGGWYANRLLSAAAAAAALGSAPALAQTGGELPKDENPVLRQSVTTGNATRQTITLSAANNPVDIFQVPGTTLTLTLGGLIKQGGFPSTITGGRITVTGGNDLNASVTGGDLTIESVLGGDFALVKTGTGTLELAATDAAHNFNGGVFLQQGAVRIKSDLNLGAGSGAGNDVVFNGGTLWTVGNLAFGSDRVLFVARAGGAFRVDSGAATITKSDQLRSNTGTFSGPLFKDGTGVLRIDSDNSYNGVVTVRQGVLELRNAGALGGASGKRSDITLNNGTSLNLRADDKFPINFGNKLGVAGVATLDVNQISSSPPPGADNRMLLGALDLNGSSSLRVQGGNRSVEFTGPVTIVPSGTTATSPTLDAVVNVRLTGQVTGDGSFNKAGAGRLTLAGGAPNTYTGLTRVTAGVLELAKTPGSNAVPDNLLVEGGGSVLLSAGAQISDFAQVTLGGQLGPGTLDLNGQNDIVGTLVVNNGTFRTRGGRVSVTGQLRNPGLVAPAGDVGAAVVPTVTVLSGGSTTIDAGASGGGTLDTLALIVSGGTNLVDVNGMLSVGAGGMQFTGTANPTLQLSADAGSAANVPGQLVLRSDASFDGASGTAEVRTVGVAPDAGTLDLDGGTRRFTVTNAAAAFQLSSRITNGGIQKEGPGVLRLTGANTYAGGTTVTTGFLDVTDPAGLGTAPVTFSGGTLRLRNDAAAATFANDLTTSAAGNVRVDVGTTTGVGAAGTFTMQAATLGASLDVTGTTGGTLAIPGTTTLQANVTVTNAVGVSLTGPVVGGFNLTKEGAGMLTLGGASGNGQGSTTVNEGTLQLAKASGPAVPNNLTVTPGGVVRLAAAQQIADTANVHLNSAAGGGTAATFDLNGFDETVGTLTGSTATERVVLGTGTLTVAPALGGVTLFTGQVSGAGRLVKAGNSGSTLNLTGANTFTGGATVSAGTLTFTQQAPQHVGAALNGGVWQVSSGGALNFNVGSNITTNAADVTLSGATSSFAKVNTLATNTGAFAVTDGRNFTTAGALSNTGTLRVGGPGAASTLTVSGAVAQHSGSTLTAGAWEVRENGTLNFNAGSNITTVGSAASVTLSGPGSSFPKVNGLATVQAGGRFTVTGARSFTTAGSLSNAGTLTAGPGATLSVTGAVTGPAGTTEVQAGGALTASSVEQNLLDVGGGTVTVRAKSAGGGTSVLTALAFDGTAAAWSGRLDLADTDLVIRDGDRAAVTSQVRAGANFAAGGYWTGASGITSSAAAADPTRMTALGVLLNDNGAGQPVHATFGGKAVAFGDVLVAPTVYGDANLDRQVTGADYALIDAGFAFGSGDWAGGDFDYSGTVDAADYARIDAGFAAAAGEAAAAPLVAAHAERFGVPYTEAFAAIRDGTYVPLPATGVVPEPGAGTLLLAAGAAGLLTRRRRPRV